MATLAIKNPVAEAQQYGSVTAIGRSVDRTRRVLLGAGLSFRLLTFLFLDPENNDSHSLVVSFIVQHGRIPHSGELGQAYHPPLYYILVAPLYRWCHSFKAVQAVSLLFSLGTLLVLYKLIYDSQLIRSEAARRYSFMLACFLPQFISFTLFLSNDTLAIFLGCCMAWCVLEFTRRRDTRSLGLMMLVAALGLLTKATFLAYLPVVFLLIVVVSWNKGLSAVRSLTLASAAVVVLLAATSYKEVDNYRHYHHVFLCNIDFHPPWVAEQQQSYRGFSSYIDFNFARLLAPPTSSAATESSYPLMLFATFWYQHISNSNFNGASNPCSPGSPMRYTCWHLFRLRYSWSDVGACFASFQQA